jgi:hypothetical protein
MLRAGSLWIPILMRSLDFYSSHNPSSCTMVLGFTQPLTGMSARNVPKGKTRLTHKADGLAATTKLIVYKMWDPQHFIIL